MFFTYILKSKKNRSYYIGCCENKERRLKEYNRGLVKSTKRYLPWELVYFEIFEDLRSARQRELQVKSLKKRKAIGKLIKTFQNYK